MAYRAAPPDSSVVLACSLLVARRALVAALVSALTAAGYYAAAGPEGAMVWGPLLLLAVFLLRASVQRSARVTLRVDARRRRLWMRSGQQAHHCRSVCPPPIVNTRGIPLGTGREADARHLARRRANTSTASLAFPASTSPRPSSSA